MSLYKKYTRILTVSLPHLMFSTNDGDTTNSEEFNE